MKDRRRDPLVALMADAAYRRIESRLGALAADIEVILMREDHQLEHAGSGRSVTLAQAQPIVAWAGSETFIDGRFAALIDAALNSPAMAWFQSGAAGTDNPLFSLLMSKGIRLTACDAPAEAVADYVLAGVLDHYQCGGERRKAQRQQEWMPLPFTEIGDLRWLILGFGSIGQCVARRAAAFGANITAVMRRTQSAPFAQRVVPPSALGSLLPVSDVLVLALPLTADTQGLVGTDFLARLKPGSLLVNVSRGRIVNESALLAGLARNQPGHAILDVCAVEPLPVGNPLWHNPRVTLTAHLAGMGSGLMARSDALFLNNLQRYCAGSALLHEVGV